ncbi:MAG: hypothetical protein ACOC53_01485, partial [Candidatus Saliniplasma sp.]
MTGRENIAMIKNPIPDPKNTFIIIFPNFISEIDVKLRNCIEPNERPIKNAYVVDIRIKPRI